MVNPLIEHPHEDKGQQILSDKPRKQTETLIDHSTYDTFVKSLARWPHRQSNDSIVSAMYCALGLVGEAGEYSEKVKKWHRDGNIDHLAAARELGDVLYYLTACAHCLGFTLSDIERMNREKLTDRKVRGKIHGSGDNR